MNSKTIMQLLDHRRRLERAVDFQSYLIVTLSLAVSALLVATVPSRPQVGLVSFIAIMIVSLWIKVRAEGVE